ncbi:MAG: hypothetical protein ACKO37_06610 [Vampirovibrionales bacterium]
MGDVIGDRGIGDAFILSLLHQLEVSKRAKHPESQTPAFEVILSNHDQFAWSQWLKDYQHVPSEKPSWHQGKTPHDETPRNIKLASYTRTWAISKYSPTWKQEHDKLYEWYFKHMKLLSYDPTRKTLFTHGSISREALQNLQLLLHREYHQPLAPLSDPQAFAAWVNQVNTWFQAHSHNQNYRMVQQLVSDPCLSHFVDARDLMLHTEGCYQSPLPETIATHFIHGHTDVWRKSFMDETPLPEVSLSPKLKGYPQQKRVNLDNDAYKTVDKVLPNENARMLLLTEA